MSNSDYDLAQREWAVEFQAQLDKVDVRHHDVCDPVGKRARVIDVLRVIGVYLDQHSELRHCGIYDDLYNLVLDLQALDRGRQPDTLKPVGGPKGKATPRDDEFKCYVSLAHRLAVRAGCNLTEADREVAKMLARGRFSGTKQADHEHVGQWRFPASTITNWRTNPPAAGDFEARVLETRVDKFLPSVDAMLAEGSSKSTILLWIERAVVQAPVLKSLRPIPQHSSRPCFYRRIGARLCSPQ